MRTEVQSLPAGVQDSPTDFSIDGFSFIHPLLEVVLPADSGGSCNYERRGVVCGTTSVDSPCVANTSRAYAENWEERRLLSVYYMPYALLLRLTWL